MKIIITEFTTARHFKRTADGNLENDLTLDRQPTGRSWDFEIPVEPVELKEVWRDIKGDVRELIRLAKVR